MPREGWTPGGCSRREGEREADRECWDDESLSLSTWLATCHLQVIISVAGLPTPFILNIVFTVQNMDQNSSLFGVGGNTLIVPWLAGGCEPDCEVDGEGCVGPPGERRHRHQAVRLRGQQLVVVSPVDTLGPRHTLDDAGQVEETFLSHEDLLVALDRSEGLWDRNDVVRCLVVAGCVWLVYLSHSVGSSSGREGWCWPGTGTAPRQPPPPRRWTVPTRHCPASRVQKFVSPENKIFYYIFWGEK